MLPVVVVAMPGDRIAALSALRKKKALNARASVTRFVLISLAIVCGIVLQICVFIYYQRTAAALQHDGQDPSLWEDIHAALNISSNSTAAFNESSSAYNYSRDTPSTHELHPVYNVPIPNVPDSGHANWAQQDLQNAKPSPSPAFVMRRFDGQEMSEHISRLNRFNRPRDPRKERSPTYNNLVNFTSLRNAYFDINTTFAGAHLELNITEKVNQTTKITDVRLRNASDYLEPYVVGLERARKAPTLKRDLSFLAHDGFVYNQRDAARRSQYSLITRASMDPFRHRSLSRPPKLCRDLVANSSRPWLLEFTNVWLTGNGDIYVPVASSRNWKYNDWDVHAYQYQGGVVISHWHRDKGKRLTFKGRHACKKHTKVGFSLAQYHGTTYYHATNEVVPRLFAFWEVAMAVAAADGGRIAIPEGPVVQSFMRSFGIPPQRTQVLGLHSACFFERLLVPAPFLQGAYQRECAIRTAGRIIGDNVFGTKSNFTQRTLAERRNLTDRGVPVVVLMDRATRRSTLGTKCYSTRCIANFNQLVSAVALEFADKINLQILSARDKGMMRKGIELFRSATVVVGAHGAGFSNLMYMRSSGTYAVHLGWRTTWQIYGKMARRFGVEFVNIVTKGMSQHGNNAIADIPVVILEIRRALEKEGFPLNPPVIPTNASRNAAVSIRLPEEKKR